MIGHTPPFEPGQLVPQEELAKLTIRPPREEIAVDMVNKPKHYQLAPGLEVYDLRQALAKKAQDQCVPHDQYSDWDRATEYLIRMWEKNEVEDAKKARWYLNKLIEKLGG